ncbi:hypothetical protein [Frankia canadensis]|uniref:hypothetical protein n=1 Tax=Frankia canadensis TaxID=1836972 RepID=UPI000C7AAF4E|nr:hypothetical protein [Frankia canadensis]
MSSDSGGGSGGLLGSRHVAFWTVLTGVITVLTLGVGLTARLTSGPARPTPSPTVQPPPTPSPTPTPVATTDAPTGTPSGSDPPNSTESPDDGETPTRRPAPPSPAGVAALRYTFAGASEYPCSAEGRLRSLFGAPVSLVLANGSSQPVQLYYLDAVGNRIAQATVPPGRRYSVSTHLGDAWLAATAQADCIGIFALRANSVVQFVDGS